MYACSYKNIHTYNDLWAKLLERQGKRWQSASVRLFFGTSRIFYQQHNVVTLCRRVSPSTDWLFDIKAKNVSFDHWLTVSTEISHEVMSVHIYIHMLFVDKFTNIFTHDMKMPTAKHNSVLLWLHNGVKHLNYFKKYIKICLNYY